MIRRLAGGLRSRAERAARACVERGLHPACFGYRWVRRETVPEYFARHKGSRRAGRYETVHPRSIARNPLPCNISSRDALGDVQGWWGFSFRDVPERASAETFIATIPDCRLAWYRDPSLADDFFPAVLAGDGTALDLRELRFRPGHGEVLRRSASPQRLRRATWIIERVYHNYSHWLTAHLPKLILLQRRRAIADLLLPPDRTPAIDASLRILGLEPERFPTFDPARPLRVDELTLVGTDRFRPELLRLVPEAFGVLDAPPPRRRLFISRGKAGRRRLVNEQDLWALLSGAGFERFHLEDLTFPEQVRLMREAAVVCGLHGAGLANVLFCQPGAHVVEIADPGFPNPNFYAIAAALGHRYWLLNAEPLATGQAGAGAGWCDGPEAVRPGWRDLRVDVGMVERILPGLTRSPSRPPAPGETWT